MQRKIVMKKVFKIVLSLVLCFTFLFCSTAVPELSVDARRRRIKKMKFELNTLKGYKMCPKCDSQNSEKSIFCNVCGARLPDPEDEDFTSLSENDYYTESSNQFFNADSTGNIGL